MSKQQKRSFYESIDEYPDSIPGDKIPEGYTREDLDYMADTIRNDPIHQLSRKLNDILPEDVKEQLQSMTEEELITEINRIKENCNV